MELSSILKTTYEEGCTRTTFQDSPVLSTIYKGLWLGEEMKYAMQTNSDMSVGSDYSRKELAKANNIEWTADKGYALSGFTAGLPSSLLSGEESSVEAIYKNKVEAAAQNINRLLAIFLYGNNKGFLGSAPKNGYISESQHQSLLDCPKVIMGSTEYNLPSEFEYDEDEHLYIWDDAVEGEPLFIPNVRSNGFDGLEDICPATDAADDFRGVVRGGDVRLKGFYANLDDFATYEDALVYLLNKTKKYGRISIVMSPYRFEMLQSEMELQKNIWQKVVNPKKWADKIGVDELSTPAGSSIINRIVIDPFCHDDRIYFLDLGRLELYYDYSFNTEPNGAGEYGPEFFCSMNMYGNFFMRNTAAMGVLECSYSTTRERLN